MEREKIHMEKKKHLMSCLPEVVFMDRVTRTRIHQRSLSERT
jgi:hypothetical protein